MSTVLQFVSPAAVAPPRPAPDACATTYEFDELFLIREGNRVALPVSGAATIDYDHEGGWDISGISLDAWLSTRAPTKAPRLKLHEDTVGGQRDPMWKLVHDALMVSDREEIQILVREMISEDLACPDAAE